MSSSKVFLAKEVLAEVPDQVVGYMKRYGILPRPAPPSQTVGSAPLPNPTNISHSTAPPYPTS